MFLNYLPNLTGHPVPSPNKGLRPLTPDPIPQKIRSQIAPFGGSQNRQIRRVQISTPMPLCAFYKWRSLSVSLKFLIFVNLLQSLNNKFIFHSEHHREAQTSVQWKVLLTTAGFSDVSVRAAATRWMRPSPTMTQQDLQQEVSTKDPHLCQSPSMTRQDWPPEEANKISSF